jgi:hypothetical protein
MHLIAATADVCDSIARDLAGAIDAERRNAELETGFVACAMKHE